MEYRTNGKLVLDGSMGYIGLVEKPFEVTIENGYINRKWIHKIYRRNEGWFAPEKIFRILS